MKHIIDYTLGLPNYVGLKMPNSRREIGQKVSGGPAPFCLVKLSSLWMSWFGLGQAHTHIIKKITPFEMAGKSNPERMLYVLH